jgi:3-(3-hydroxy-phenyl)propionate hydroxylase
LVQNGFRLAQLIPPLHRYFAEMKYKPRPHYGDGFLAEDHGLRLVGRMLPQPLLESVDCRRLRLDDAAGPHFAVVAYGANAVSHASAVECGALGVEDAVVIGIVPQQFTPDPQSRSGIFAARDMENRLGGITARGTDVLLFVRPDRYVAVAEEVRSGADVRSFVTSCRALIDATWDGARTAQRAVRS